MIGQQFEANKSLYGAKLPAKQLLSGKIPPTPEAEPLMWLLNSEQFYVLPGVSSTDALPAPHKQLAELTVGFPNVSPNGIHELGAAEPPKVAELGAGPQNAVYEMPTGQDGHTMYELDASQPLTPKSLAAKSSMPAWLSKKEITRKELPTPRSE